MRSTAPNTRSRRPMLLAAVFLAGAVATTGCADRADSAEQDAEAAVVPSDPNLVMRRADQARVAGEEDAPISIVEVADFQCEFCARHAEETFPGLDSLYIRPGEMRYTWISFPNPGHAYAWPAIEAAFCAGAVGRFWPMHDLLFENQQEWAEADRPLEHFLAYADEAGVESESFRACLREDRPAHLQFRDFQSVSEAGISGTPFFIINDSIPMRGFVPLEEMREVLDDLLADEGGDAEPGEEAEEGSANGTEDGEAAGGEGRGP